MLDNRYSKFFEEFPEYEGMVSFVGDEQRTADILKRIQKIDEVYCTKVKDTISSVCEDNRNCCIPVSLKGKKFFIVNIADDFDWIGQISWPLLRNNTANEFQEFITQHEIGHIIHTFLEPEEDVHKHIFLISKDGFDKVHLGEEYADSYAALKILQTHGQESLALIRRISDIRILFAVKYNYTMHATNNVLDKIYEIYSDADALAELKTLSAKALAEKALEIAKEYSQNPFDKQFQIDEWREVIFKPTLESWVKPENKILLEAVHRQLDVPIDKVDEFITKYDFEKGDLTEAFKKSVSMKIVVGINISLVNHEDMSAIQGFIEEGMLDRDALLGGSNRFPNLKSYIKTARGIFFGDKFAMMSAMSSPHLKNDMAEKYLGRETILRMAEFPQP